MATGTLRSALRRVCEGDRAAVWQFALSGLASVAVIGLLATLAFRQLARDEALADAKDLTRVAVTGVVEPSVTPALLQGNPAARRRFDRLVRRSVLGHSSVVRVKLWTRDGRIVYSDEPRLVNSRYQLEKDEREALRTGEVEADVSDLSRPENRFERGDKDLVEVYTRARGPAGQPLLFESYRRSASIAANQRHLTKAFIPALLGGLLLLQLVNVPLARALVGRVRRARRERETYLQAAMTASERERRRIAADLHDGVVQDLNGLSMSMSAEAAGADTRGDHQTSERLRAMARANRQLTRGLRNLLVDIYPPTLHREGIGPAIGDLAEGVGRRGVDVHAEVERDLELPPDLEALLFRISQEALRNVVRHAGAGRVDLRLEARNGDAVLTVSDDGRGFEADGLAEGPTSDGHLGLTALRALADDAGGTFEVTSTPGRGTEVRAEVPLR
ncbi:MAG: sensor histidine kinase [Solirubrobacteraceae bacterium]